MRDSFEAYIGLSVSSTALAAALILEVEWFSSIAAAVLVFLSLGFYTRADAIAMNQGKSKTTKLGLGLTPLLTELLLIGAVTATGYVPASIGVTTLIAVAMLESLRLNILSDMRRVIQPSIGRNWRMVLLGTTFFLSSLNPLYLFYGIAAVGGAAAYDFADMLYQALYR